MRDRELNPKSLPGVFGSPIYSFQPLGVQQSKTFTSRTFPISKGLVSSFFFYFNGGFSRANLASRSSIVRLPQRVFLHILLARP